MGEKGTWSRETRTKKTWPRQKDQLIKSFLEELSPRYWLLWWEVRKDDIIILVVTQNAEPLTKEVRMAMAVNW